MLRVRTHRDRKHVLVANQEAKRDLARRRAVSLGDLCKHPPSSARLVGKSAGTERAIPDNRQMMTLTPREHLVLDRPFEQVIEHLVAGDLVLARNGDRALQLVNIEIAHPEMTYLSRNS